MSGPCSGSLGHKYQALPRLRWISRDSRVVFQPSTNPRNWLFHQTLCRTGWVSETLIVPSGSGKRRVIIGAESRRRRGHLHPGPNRAPALLWDTHLPAPTTGSVTEPSLKRRRRKKRFLYGKGCSPYNECGKRKKNKGGKKKKQPAVTPSPAEKLDTVFGT